MNKSGQPEQIFNILRFSLRPKRVRVLVNKLMERLLEFGNDESDAARRWAQANEMSLDNWLESIDHEMWRETSLTATEIRNGCKATIRKLEALGIDLGGGGSLELLYFWTRKVKPRYILETGVAAGWSSYAFLLAIKKNALGILLSSDLPYFRIKDPEKFIGILVPNELKGSHWRMEIQGDDLNFRHLLTANIKLQVVHYDSDKRKNGRKRFFSTIESFLDDNSVVIMDDIQNNLAFKEYVEAGNKSFVVIESEGKYVGIALLGKYSSFIG